MHPSSENSVYYLKWKSGGYVHGEPQACKLLNSLQLSKPLDERRNPKMNSNQSITWN
ncbi:hypothetical protein IC582_007164 [Cucumis melo]